MSRTDLPLARAYAHCRRIATMHYENFPVASWLLPGAMRPHVAAIYAFARRADDAADEGDVPDRVRLRRLDEWHGVLSDAAAGRHPATSSVDTALIRAALAETIRVCSLPVVMLEDLLSAFRQDVTHRRYETWDELMDYCARSANPIGRLVLRIAGYRGDDIDRQSDSVCTALQVTNFIQDLGSDWERGRIYVPTEIYRTCGAVESGLETRRLSGPWRRAIEETARRTTQLFDDGRGVCDAVTGRLRLELRLTWLGGRRILSRLERSGYDPIAKRPVIGLTDAVPLLWEAAAWRFRQAADPAQHIS